MSTIIRWFNDRYSRQLVGIDIAYNSHSKLDVYEPRRGSQSPRGVIIFWYGGSWTHGDKSLYRFAAQHWANKTNSIVIIPDYQKFPDVHYPYFIDEAWEVVRWAKMNAPRYGARLESYSVIGHSSGAHTASSVALGYRKPDDLALPAKCVSLAGPTYIVEKPFWPIFSMDSYDHSRFPTHFATLKTASPRVAFLVVHGKLDRIVSPKQSVKFYETLRAHKFTVRLLRPFTGHPSLIVTLGLPFAHFSRTASTIMRFLNTKEQI